MQSERAQAERLHLIPWFWATNWKISIYYYHPSFMTFDCLSIFLSFTPFLIATFQSFQTFVVTFKWNGNGKSTASFAVSIL